ncbi:DUF805 domain-containing protein [Vitreoscilla massiliensis]|uniref:DUF805 domain-containing protein n=1 Tax=Vitreoscilla massiliensis TaxID=1689272 RepID=A0ABY4DZ83_9NEIS|nr:DUF805 domain-containing protein [Vitreoscilla massiliensis]UOO88309.1 DUF805 domain-containing protein [Vitreoscilla massiliensis]
MKGKVLDFSIQKGGGLILGDDGQRYLLVTSEWQEQSFPLRDVVVDFEAAGQYAKGVYLLAQTVPQIQAATPTIKAKPFKAIVNKEPSLLDLAISAVKHKYLLFNGRASRKEFWAVMLFSVLISFALQLLYTLGFAISDNLGLLLALPFVIFALGMVIPQLAVSARRLHDTDKSGWWLLLGLIPIFGTIALIVLFSLTSSEGENRFGEPA